MFHRFSSICVAGIAACVLSASSSSLIAAPISVGSGPDTVEVLFNWPDGFVADYDVHYGTGPASTIDGYDATQDAAIGDSNLTLDWTNFGTATDSDYSLNVASYTGGHTGDGATYDPVNAPNNFWAEWVNIGGSGWAFGNGASDDFLGNNDQIGWVFGNDGTPVPEPAAATLLAVGAACLLKRRSRRGARVILALGFLSPAIIPLAASAQVSTGASVVNYTPGSISTTYGSSDGSPALGLPAPIVDSFGGFEDYLTPFYAAYTPDEMVGIGPGGSLTLQMSEPVATNGFTIGVHAGVGLNDANYPDGQNTSPATVYTDDRTADLSVSQDGIKWFDLGNVDFDEPSNYYADGSGGPYSNSPGTQVANFAQPFIQPTADPLGVFDGTDWTGTLAALNGSAGGTWFDLSGSGLSSIDFVRFTVGTGQQMYVDSVVGIPVPEPATLGVAAIGALLLARKRR